MLIKRLKRWIKGKCCHSDLHHYAISDQEDLATKDLLTFARKYDGSFFQLSDDQTNVHNEYNEKSKKYQ